MNNGKYIVLEGLTGVGKSTQIQELARRLRSVGLDVRTIQDSEPYDLVTSELNMLTSDQNFAMNPETKLLLSSANQSQVLRTVKSFISHGLTCLVEGSSLATLAYNYYGHNESIDYETISSLTALSNKELKPDLVILLDTPIPDLMARLNSQEAEKDPKFDATYLEKVRAGFLWEAKQRDVPIVFANGGKEAVANNIWRLVSDLMRQRPIHSSTPVTSEAIISNSAPDFTASKPSVEIGDSRVSLEPTQAAILKPKSRPKDPHMSLISLEITASNLLIATLMQYGVSVSGNEKSAMAQAAPKQHDYYEPKSLNPKTKQLYESLLQQIFSHYDELNTQLDKFLLTQPKTKFSGEYVSDCLAQLLPVAKTSLVNISFSSQQLEGILSQLLNHPLEEARQVGKIILKQSAKKAPHDTKKPIEPNKYLMDLLGRKGNLKQAPSETEFVKLTDYWPRNELKLLPEVLYPYLNLPLEDISNLADSWTYDEKLETINRFATTQANSSGLKSSLLKQLGYSWDIVWDFSSLMELLAQNDISLSWQQLSPRYGYDEPGLFSEAGLSEAYETIFDLSLKLSSDLEAAGHPDEVAYASLLGHRLRMRLKFDGQTALSLASLIKSSSSPSYTKLLSSMQEAIGEVQPIMAKHIFG